MTIGEAQGDNAWLLLVLCQRSDTAVASQHDFRSQILDREAFEHLLAYIDDFDIILGYKCYHVVYAILITYNCDMTWIHRLPNFDRSGA